MFKCTYNGVMNYISTTGLRTQSSQLISLLSEGKTVELFHRSKLVGRVVPVKKIEKHKKDFSEFIVTLPKIKRLTQKKAMKNYMESMVKKHGKDLS